MVIFMTRCAQFYKDKRGDMELLNSTIDFTDTVECYGRFDIRASLCRKHCAVRLRCAIEQSQQLRIEQLEDMMNAYEMPSKVQ